MKSRLCIFLLLLSAMVSAYGQGHKKPGTEADYRWRTLREMTTLQPDYVANSTDLKDPSLNIVVHGDLLPSRVKVLYDGTTRPLVERKQVLITNWTNRPVEVLEFYTAPYQTEMLFTEEGQSYWLVVRNDSLPQFEQQFKKGDVIELFLVKLGNIRIDEKLEPVVLVDKFGKQ